MKKTKRKKRAGKSKRARASKGPSKRSSKRKARKGSRSRKATSSKRPPARRPHKAKRTRPKRSKAAPYTVVFSGRATARDLIDSMRSPATRRAWRGALRSHPGGGVYIALPAWRGSLESAKQNHAAALSRLAYEAGRRRKRFSGGSVRVAAVPR